MTRRAMAVVGLLGFTWLAPGCDGTGTAGTGGSGTRPPTDTSARALADSLRNYLSTPGTGLPPTGRLYDWEVAISKAVCNIEKYAPGIPPGGDRYCPGTGQWPPAGTPPPKFPPGP